VLQLTAKVGVKAQDKVKVEANIGFRIWDCGLRI